MLEFEGFDLTFEALGRMSVDEFKSSESAVRRQDEGFPPARCMVLEANVGLPRLSDVARGHQHHRQSSCS